MLDLATALSESTVTWADLKWICKARSGPIIVTGIFVGDDARRAIDEGAAAVVVSNRGGRQLDSAHASVRALREIVGAVHDQVEIMMDGRSVWERCGQSDLSRRPRRSDRACTFSLFLRRYLESWPMKWLCPHPKSGMVEDDIHCGCAPYTSSVDRPPD